MDGLLALVEPTNTNSTCNSHPKRISPDLKEIKILITDGNSQLHCPNRACARKQTMILQVQGADSAGHKREAH